MPGKSRRKRKYSASPKKGAGGLSPAAVPARQPAAQAGEPVASPDAPLPPAKAPAPAAKSVIVQHPYIATELWTICILAVVMLVVLIVLALVPLPW